MDIRKEYQWFLGRYGTQVRVEGESFQAILLPASRTTVGRRERGDYTPAGKMPLDEYIYMGPVGRALPVDSLLSCGGREFVVRSSMEVLFENAPLYTRAILTPAEVASWR